jgi:hypothetical protein
MLAIIHEYSYLSWGDVSWLSPSAYYAGNIGETGKEKYIVWTDGPIIPYMNIVMSQTSQRTAL